MPAVWVTAQFINDSKKPGGKFGSIKDPNLGYISVPVSELGQFRKGARYCIEIEEVGQYKNFIRFAGKPPSNPENAPAPAGGYSGYRRPATQQAQTQARPAAPQQRVSPPVPPQAIPADPMALNIFVTGIVGRALGSGHFTAQDIKELTQEAKAAFLAHLSGNPELPATRPAPQRERLPAGINEPMPEPFYDDPIPHPDQYGHDPNKDLDNDSVPY